MRPARGDSRHSVRAAFIRCAVLAFAFACVSGLAKDKPPIWGIDDPTAPDSATPIQEFRKETGINPLIVAWREDFSQPFPKKRCARIWAGNRLPLIFWDAEFADDGQNLATRRNFTLEGILQGSYDVYFQSWADDAAAYKEPVLVHLFRQFNHSSHPWSIGANGRDASRVAAAYRKIVSIFRERGARNVKWVWGPNVFPSPPAGWNRWEAAYPGDSYVNYVALDGLDFGEAGLASMPLTFEQLFSVPVKELRHLAPHKPIVISSVATCRSHPEREQWLREMSNSLLGPLSSIRGIVWFNYTNRVNWGAQKGDALGLLPLLAQSQDSNSVSAFLEHPFWLLALLPSPQDSNDSPETWKIPCVSEANLAQLPSVLQDLPVRNLNALSATLIGRELASQEIFAARVRLGWNSRGLLLWCEVDDHTLGDSRSEPEKIWDGDGIELAIGPPSAEAKPTASNEGYRLLISPGGAHQIKPSIALVRMNDGSLQAKTEGIQINSQFGITSQGYRIYGIIPWKTLGFEPTAESKIPFDISITDGVNGRRVRQLIWCGGAHAYHDSAEWGLLELLPR